MPNMKLFLAKVVFCLFFCYLCPAIHLLAAFNCTIKVGEFFDMAQS